MKLRALLPALAVALTATAASAQYIDATYDDQPYCREFTQPVHVAGRIQQGYGTACMQPDGQWQVVQAPTTHRPAQYVPPPPAPVSYVQPVSYIQPAPYYQPYRPYYRPYARPYPLFSFSFVSGNLHGGNYHNGGHGNGNGWHH